MGKSKVFKPIVIVLAVVAAVVLLSVLQYVIQWVNDPVDQPGPEISGNGVLIWGAGPDESAVIPVSASLSRKHYVFGNKEDAICLYKLTAKDRTWEDDGIWLYWVPILEGDKGASVKILGEGDFGFFYSSGDMGTLILGINDASRIVDSSSGAEGKKAVLILPADEDAAAAGLVRDAFADGYAGKNLKNWLSENQLGFSYFSWVRNTHVLRIP